MRFKKKKNYKIEFIGLRCTTKERNRLQIKANLYTDGNLSEYLIYCGLNFTAGNDDLEKEGQINDPR